MRKSSNETARNMARHGDITIINPQTGQTRTVRPTRYCKGKDDGPTRQEKMASLAEYIKPEKRG